MKLEIVQPKIQNYIWTSRTKINKEHKNRHFSPHQVLQVVLITTTVYHGIDMVDFKRKQDLLEGGLMGYLQLQNKFNLMQALLLIYWNLWSIRMQTNYRWNHLQDLLFDITIVFWFLFLYQTCKFHVAMYLSSNGVLH